MAVDAPPASYLLNIGTAGDVGVDAEDVQGVLVALAPIVGTARIASAATKLVRALDLAIDIAELEGPKRRKVRNSSRPPLGPSGLVAHQGGKHETGSRPPLASWSLILRLNWPEDTSSTSWSLPARAGEIYRIKSTGEKSE